MPFILCGPSPLRWHLSVTPTSPSLIKKLEIESPYSAISANGELWAADFPLEGGHREVAQHLSKSH